MYDRAPRKLTTTVGSTAENVGPGSYTRPDAAVRYLGEGYAPFSSLADRNTNLVPDSVITAPGPGQYDPKFPHDHAKGVSSMLSKSSRFRSVASEIPGPGAYNVKTDFARQAPFSAPLLREKAAKQKPQSLSMSHIKYSRKTVAPSIPCPGQAFGYEENEDGSLSKQGPPTRDESIGPAYYCPAYGDTLTTKTYKGVHWSQMKTSRSYFAAKDGPGPGEYDPHQIASVSENVTVHDTDKSKFESYVPRFTDKIIQIEKKQGNPGPGAYKVKREFDDVDRKAAKDQADSMATSHPPFLTQSKRFVSKKAEAPPPGAYNDPRSALESLKKVTGLKRSPFGQTSVRFDRDRRASEIPAPNVYSSMRGMAAESMYKAYLSSTQKGAFGSTTERRNMAVNKDAANLPGPGSYKVVDDQDDSRQPAGRNIVHESSTFASRSERISKPVKSAVEGPPPTAYNVISSFQAIHGKTEPRPPRNSGAKRRHESFLSATSRFVPPRDIVIAEADPHNPGPGSYNPQMITGKGNMLTSHDVREKPIKDSNPGPGYYELSPLMMDTVLRGSFNVTLSNQPPPSRWFATKKVDVEPPAVGISGPHSAATVMA